jgi:site-specific recombinase XerD
MKKKRKGIVAASAKQVCVGPIAPYVNRFATFLAGEGYVPATVKIKCSLVADLNLWLKRRQLSLVELDEQTLEQFHTLRRSLVGRGDAFTGNQLLQFLRHLEVVPAPSQKIDRTALDQLTRDYERFLSSERGLARTTVTSYLPIVRKFLIEHFADKALHLQDLRPQDLHRFILGQVRRVSRAHAATTVTALRSFLRFLRQRGAIKTDLAAALFGVARWRLSHIPKSLPGEQVGRLLQCCDRNTPSGQRDYAILLLLARLGLRGGEVLSMTLDDLDWERGEIVVRGKGPRLERLPLPKDVGAALVYYLRHVRPPCSTRRVFIRMRAPQHGLRLSAICCVVRRALKRAGLNPDFKGAHLLRHSLATKMLRRGASLDEIGQLLRHRQLTTTQIYAKVDIKALRGIAIPWMGGAS